MGWPRARAARAAPLSYAARAGHLHIVRLLLEHGAQPNTPEDSAPNGAALFNACSGNHIEVVRLWSKGTPLAAAVRAASANAKQVKRTRQMVKVLLDRGAAKNLPDDEPWATPLAWARKRGLRDIERLLREHGAH